MLCLNTFKRINWHWNGPSCGEFLLRNTIFASMAINTPSAKRMKMRMISWLSSNLFPLTKLPLMLLSTLSWLLLTWVKFLVWLVLVFSYLTIYLQNPNSDPVQLKRDKNYAHTHLIVIASQDSNDMKYYIDLENKLISVCRSYIKIIFVQFKFCPYTL